jgi:hypothetical protein
MPLYQPATGGGGGGTGAVDSVNGRTGVVTGLAETASNLSDLGSVAAARTNLALGGAAVLAVGTSTGTVAAGDDSRVTGAAQKASNLSDLANAGTARTNLGLGGAATLAVGTGSGTVAAGDDSRITTAAARFTVTAVKTANYTAAANEFVPVDTTSGNVTITLPTAPADGTRVGVKQVVRGASNTVGLALGGSDVFNVAAGATTGTITLLNQGVILQYRASGAIWYATSIDLALSQLDARYASLAGTNTATLASSTIQYLDVEIPDDGSSTAGWPDRMAFYFTPSGGTRTRTGYHNEYGELRGRPAKTNTVALRALGHADGSTVDIFQVSSPTQSSVYFGVSNTTATSAVPLAVTGNVTATGNITATGTVGGSNITTMAADITTLTAAGKAITGNNQTGTTYTLVLADAGKCVEGNNASAITFTIPPNSSVAFPVGTVIEIFQQGAGQITVAAGASVTLRAPDGAKLAKQYASASIRQRATDEWVLAGSVTT